MNWILENLMANTWLAIFLYWIPLAICAVGYVIKTWTDYRGDIARREQAGKYYAPTLKLGTIVFRVLATPTPGVNLAAAAFDALPEIARLLEQWLDIPLVPERK